MRYDVDLKLPLNIVSEPWKIVKDPEGVFILNDVGEIGSLDQVLTCKTEVFNQDLWIFGNKEDMKGIQS